MSSVCEQIHEQLEGLFSCREHSKGTRVTTPFTLPDGTLVYVFVLRRDESFTVTDFGAAVQWLHTIGGSTNFTEKRKKILEEIQLTQRVEFRDGVLVDSFVQPENLGDAVIRVATSVINVADIHFTFQQRASKKDFTDEVAEIIRLDEFGYERRVPLTGNSQKQYTVDFRVDAPADNPVYVDALRTTSNQYASQLTQSVHSKWNDLKDRLTGTEPAKPVTIFDDREPVWKETDVRLAGQVCKVFFWSEIDDFRGLLRERIA